VKKLNVVISSILVSSVGWAVELPRASPDARLMQTIGLTEVTVEYSSPAVRGRTIWGDLVKYDQVWRTGANAATKVTFSKDVTIDKKEIPAGAYALFVIPHKAGPWTMVLNKEATQAGADHYDAKKDVLAVEVKPEAIAPRERMTFLFADFTDDAGTLELEWDKVRLSLPIAVHTQAQVADTIGELDRRGWHVFNEVAVYELERKKDTEAALKWVELSLKVKEDWFNAWTKAQILAAKGSFRQAAEWGQRAQVLGGNGPGYRNHADDVKKAVAEWKHKS
jgi:hypothetical protein